MYVRYASFVMLAILFYRIILSSYRYVIYVVIKYLLILISKHCLSGVEYRKVYDSATDK